MFQYILLRMHVCFCCVWCSLSVLSQAIDWEERLRNDLHSTLCVKKTGPCNFVAQFHYYLFQRGDAYYTSELIKNKYVDFPGSEMRPEFTIQHILMLLSLFVADSVQGSSYNCRSDHLMF